LNSATHWRVVLKLNIPVYLRSPEAAELRKFTSGQNRGSNNCCFQSASSIYITLAFSFD